MDRRLFERGVSLMVLAMGLADAGLATAQSTPQPPASAPTVGEVIVTAQRRSENLQRVPVSVAVVSAEALAKQNITTESDLQFASPGLSVRTGATSNEVNYALRGQSLDQYSGATPGVLPYINEVQISTNSGGGSGATAFYDLQSVQVLKGPQGTLFGRDATGGAVLFTTAKPSDTFGGYVSARGGDYGTVQLEGALNLPIVPDKVLARIAGFYGRQDGYQYNLYDGSRPGTGYRVGVRPSLTLKPVDGLTNELVVDYYHIDGSSLQSVLYNLQNIPGATPAPYLYSPAAGPLWTAYLATHTNPTVDPAGLSDVLARQTARGPFQTATNDDSLFRGTNVIVTNTTSYDLGAHTTLKNIFGFGSLKSHTEGDSDGSPYGIAGDSLRSQAAGPLPGPFGADTDTRIVSDELQLAGTTLDQKLTYTTGLYFQDARATLRVQSSFFDLFGGVLSLNDAIQENITYGVYGQGTYDLGAFAHGLSFIAGLRYNNEQARHQVLPDDENYGLQAASLPGVYKNDQSRTFGNVGWTFGLQEQVDPALLIYVVTRRSYKDGGFNSTLAPKVGYSDVGGDAYRTESVTDVEGGVKFQSLVQGVPTRLNIAIYNNWVENSQRAAFASVDGNPSAITVNVPEQQDLGVEFDGQLRPVSWLSLGGSVNYIDARFTRQTVDAFGVVQSFATVPDTAKWSGTFYGEITAPVSDRLTASLRADVYSQTGTAYSSSANVNVGARLPGYTVTDFRIALADGTSGWTLSANLKNAFNKVYYVGGIPLAQLLDYNTALPGAPRTYTVELRYKF